MGEWPWGDIDLGLRLIVVQIYENANKYNGNVNNGIVLGGFSAGGQLAGSLAIKSRLGDIPVPVSGLILRSPWLSDWRALTPELEKSLESIESNANAPYVTSERLRLMLEWYNVPENERSSPKIFPLNLEPQMAKHLPPTVIQTAGADPLRDEGRTLYRLLTEAGAPAKLFHYEVSHIYAFRASGLFQLITSI